jgi:lipopolysaccharide transport system permease protein
MSKERHKQIITYSSESSVRHPWKLWAGMMRDLAGSRNLAWQLAVRDIKAQYRQAALGFAWAFIVPVANTAVWIFVQSSGIVSLRETHMPYSAFVISGTLFWSIFMDAVNAPLQQAQSAKAMLTKINFPHEALVISGMTQTAFNGAIKIAIMLIALAALGIMPSTALAALPAIIAITIMIGTALGVVLAPIGLLYTDVGRGLPLALQFLMYLCPIVYAAPETGKAAALIEANPLTQLVRAMRQSLSGHLPTNGEDLIFIAISAAAVLLVGWMIYRIAAPILIERMGS